MIWVLVLMINNIALDISGPMDYYQCQNSMVRYMRENPKHREIVRCEYRPRA